MKNVNLTVDFVKKIGVMKPMHGVGQPPQPANNALCFLLTPAWRFSLPTYQSYDGQIIKMSQFCYKICCKHLQTPKIYSIMPITR